MKLSSLQYTTFGLLAVAVLGVAVLYVYVESRGTESRSAIILESDAGLLPEVTEEAPPKPETPLTTPVPATIRKPSSAAVKPTPSNQQTAPVTPSADTEPPKPPSNLTVIEDPDHQQRTIDWDAATDNVGVAGYYIYFYFSISDDSPGFGKVPETPLHKSEGSSTELIHAYPYCDGSPRVYIYFVRAFDAAGNLSDPISRLINDQDQNYCYPIVIGSL